MQGCRIRCLPPRLDEGGLHLSLPGPAGLWRLCAEIRKMDVQLRAQLGMNRPLGILTGLFVLSRIFRWIYLITRDEKAVGMLGAYSWEPRGHAFLTMVIWDERDRRRGTGSRAVSLAVRELSARKLCRSFFVEVKKANPGAVRFWERNGFEVTGRNGEILTMSLQKKQDTGASGHFRQRPSLIGQK